MNDLGTHIIELLNESPEVYLPGIGIFRKERVPAIFDENTNIFLAPTHRIVLHEEQGSALPLIDAIVKSTGNTFHDCEEQLKATTGAILLELNEKGESEIQHLGKLIKKERIVSFIPIENEESSLPFYKSVKERKLIAPKKKDFLENELIEEELNEEELIDEESDHRPEAFVVNDSLSASEQEELEEEQETTSFHASASESKVEEPEFEPKGKSINWLWPILIILVLIVVGIVFLLKPTPKNTEPSLVEKNKTERLLPDTSVTTIIPIEIDSPNVKEVDTLSAQAVDPVANAVPVKEKITYEIIIVSFGKLAEAENYLETMLKKGYPLRILKNRRPGNLYKISYGSFNSGEEAQIALNKVRESLAKDAWIYKAKQ